MDLTTRLHYPIIRPSGMDLFSLSEYSEIKDGKYTLTRTGERFTLFDELKKCCLSSSGNVAIAFSNIYLSLDVTLKIGRITHVDLTDYIPDGFLTSELVLVAYPIYVGIRSREGEWIHPYFLYSDPKRVSITASAGDDCPNEFETTSHFEFHLAFSSNDRAVQLLHKSIFEFSQNRPNFAVIFLYAAVETASTILSRNSHGRLSSRFSDFIRQIECLSPIYAKTVRKIKKKIEKRIVAKRGDFAHKGNDLIEKDLLPCYETALELFWHYSELKNLESK